MINTVQWFIVNPVKIRLEIKKKEKIRMQKRNILAIFVGLIIGLYTVLGMSLFTFLFEKNIKNSAKNSSCAIL